MLCFLDTSFRILVTCCSSQDYQICLPVTFSMRLTCLRTNTSYFNKVKRCHYRKSAFDWPKVVRQRLQIWRRWSVACNYLDLTTWNQMVDVYDLKNDVRFPPLETIHFMNLLKCTVKFHHRKNGQFQFLTPCKKFNVKSILSE